MISLSHAWPRRIASQYRNYGSSISRWISTNNGGDASTPADQLPKDISPVTSTSTSPREPLQTKRTFYQRQNGNRPLPLSSFLDPFRIEQRHRHRNRTPKPEAPAYQNLSPFRQKLAHNVYAKLLAQPIRPCTVTGASLPQSMLLNFSQLRDPTPPHKTTLVPLVLYNDSIGPMSDAQKLAKNRGMAQSISKNSKIVQWLVDYYEATGSMSGALASYEGKMAPNTVGTIDKLLADVVMRTLSWPFKYGSKDFVSLPGGIEDLHLCPEPSVVLFFGGSVRNPRIAELETILDDLILVIDTMLKKYKLWRRGDKHATLSSEALPGANPRVINPPVELTTVEYVPGHGTVLAPGQAVIHSYCVPIIPMVDIIGEEAVKKLLKGTKHEGSSFVAVKSTMSTTDQVVQLIKCAWWNKEGNIKRLSSQSKAAE